ADIILLLISPDFLASSYCERETQQALQRQEVGKTHAIPILLRPTAWESSPLTTLQALPRDRKPVTSWRRRDEAFFSIVRDIQQVVEVIQKESASQVIWVERGDRAMANRQYHAALDAYERAIAYEPSNVAAAYAGQGNALRSLGRH